MLIRLDKYLADMQQGTRSQVKELIRKKKVYINNELALKPEIKVDIDKDTIVVDGKNISFKKFEYYMLNKPAGVISATQDKEKTVIDLITTKNRKDLFPVGRLDKDTEGLLLITNDGELSHNLLSPKKHVDKLYYAKVKGQINDKHVKAFSDGLEIDSEFKALPAVLKALSYDSLSDTSEIHVTIHEGKFHQVKRMFEAINSEVIYLKRLSMGSLKLDESLKSGEYRELTQEELDKLK